jgi:hypothetical protein
MPDLRFPSHETITLSLIQYSDLGIPASQPGVPPSQSHEARRAILLQRKAWSRLSTSYRAGPEHGRVLDCRRRPNGGVVFESAGDGSPSTGNRSTKETLGMKESWIDTSNIHTRSSLRLKFFFIHLPHRHIWSKSYPQFYVIKKLIIFRINKVKSLQTLPIQMPRRRSWCHDD